MSDYAAILGLSEHRYKSILRVKEMLVGYLSPALAFSLKKLVLLSRPCGITSDLVGKAYEAADQAGGSLHTMALLQA